MDDKKKMGPISATYTSPLLAAGTGAGFLFGASLWDTTSASQPAKFHIRLGLSGGLLFLGFYSGMLAFQQDNEIGRSFCVAGFGAGNGLGTSIAADYCEKTKKYLKPPSLRTVLKRGFGGCLMSMSMYGGARVLYERGWAQLN